MVFDTMVLAYALLGVTEFCDEAAEALARADAVWAPDLVRAELTNVVWQWVRWGRIPIDEGINALHQADALLTEVIPTNHLWEQALRLAVDSAQSPYDTLFMALADRRGSRLVTYDRALLKQFPADTLTVQDFLASLEQA